LGAAAGDLLNEFWRVLQHERIVDATWALLAWCWLAARNGYRSTGRTNQNQ